MAFNDNFGKPLRPGNYDGRVGEFDYRAGGTAGCWNLYRNHKFVKVVATDKLVGMLKAERKAARAKKRKSR